MDEIPRSLPLILLLIVLGGFFASAETAYALCSRVRLLAWEDDGKRSARRATKILEHQDKAIITLLIGNNVVHVAATAMATALAIRLIRDDALASLVSTVLMTLLVFIFSETIPKNIAKARSDELACAYSAPLSVLMFLLTPVSFLFLCLQKLGKKLLRTREEGPAMTEDDFTTMIESIEDEGVLEKDESELIQSAAKFSDRKVQEILTPRVHIVGLDLTDGPEVCHSLIMEEKYTRLPVYRKDLDHIVGVLNTKQYLQKAIEMPGVFPDISALMTEPYMIRGDMTLHSLVEEMRRRKMHLAIVQDPWGGTEGLVALEDLLEELVGDIWDEDESPCDEIPGEKADKC